MCYFKGANIMKNSKREQVRTTLKIKSVKSEPKMEKKNEKAKLAPSLSNFLSIFGSFAHTV